MTGMLTDNPELELAGGEMMLCNDLMRGNYLGAMVDIALIDSIENEIIYDDW